MKKVGLILGVILVIIAVFVFVNKLYYPSLPIEGISAKEAIEKLKESNSEIVEIALEGNSRWYITSKENKGLAIAEENIKQMVESNGWEFKQKDGAGLFFEKEGERLIATTQMWTKNYVLVKIPKNFN
ncbi:hypothetical protein [Paenisporosarcina sp. NPDC076898]|uniref:hypothetical protein n=1 Tax=unclassified Paenisporosarcina TaxID=2642018 RepID=UPI003D02F92F